MRDENVTDIKSAKIVGTLNLTKAQVAFLDSAFDQLGAKRDTANAFAGLCEQLDKIKGE